jgi:hypothetical protein
MAGASAKWPHRYVRLLTFPFYKGEIAAAKTIAALTQ